MSAPDQNHRVVYPLGKQILRLEGRVKFRPLSKGNILLDRSKPQYSERQNRTWKDSDLRGRVAFVRVDRGTMGTSVKEGRGRGSL